MPTITPDSQAIYINSSQTRIFDFNTISSHVYLGEAVNSLLRAFGNNIVSDGLRIKHLEMINNIVYMTISSGEAILDSTLVNFNSDINLELDVSGFDDNGLLIPNISFKFIQTQQKNLSRVKLSYLDSNNKIQHGSWFTDVSTIVLGIIEFNKETQSISKQIIPYFNRPKIMINDKEYTVYPTDQISNRMLSYIHEHLRL